MATHPGAYVRGIRQLPELDLRVPEGYELRSIVRMTSGSGGTIGGRSTGRVPT